MKKNGRIGRPKKHDFIKAKSISLSLQKSVIKALESMDNRSEIANEILLENIDSINDGTIENAIKARKAQLYNIVVEALQHNKGEIVEVEKSITKINSILSTINVINTQSSEVRDAMDEIRTLSNSIRRTLGDTSMCKSLSESIVDGIDDKLDEICEDMCDIE